MASKKKGMSKRDVDVATARKPLVDRNRKSGLKDQKTTAKYPFYQKKK